MIKSNQRFLNAILVIIDIFVIFFSFIIAWLIRFKTSIFYIVGGHIGLSEFLIPALAIIPIYIIGYQINGLYQSQRNRGIVSEIWNIIKSNIIVFILFISILFVFKQINYPRLAIGIFTVLNVALSIAERSIIRLVLRSYRRRGYNLKHILIVGTGGPAENFAEKIKIHTYLGYNIVGYLDDTKKIGYKIKDANVIGRIDDLGEILKDKSLDEIIIAIELSQYDKLGKIIAACEKYGVKAQIIPDYYRYIPAKPYIDQIDDLHLINIRYIPLDDSFNKFIKRTSDIFLAMIGIILTSPVLLISAILVQVTSPGPILFSQVRVGLNRKKFKMYKFRSMKIQKQNEEQRQWTTKNDPRKTQFGNFIRKTSIDELPQLFNVIKGDMSLIGPRPERPFFVDKFREEIPKYMVKHLVRPGITGWAQVNGFRGDTSIKARIEHDIYYIENWSIGLDMKIILLTIYKGFINKNAY